MIQDLFNYSKLIEHFDSIGNFILMTKQNESKLKQFRQNDVIYKIQNSRYKIQDEAIHKLATIIIW